MKRKLKLYLLRLFRLKSSTHKIALGVSLGFLPNWVPSFGIGPFLSLALAKIFRANVSAALIGAISGSFAWPLLFYLNYKVGALVLFQKSTVEDIQEVDYVNTSEKIIDFNSIGLHFVTGMLINCIVFTIILYIFFYILFKKYRLLLLSKVRKM